MKICILTHTFPRFEGDPSAPFMGELVETLSKTGNKVIVLTPFDRKIDERYPKNFRLVSYKYIFPKSLHILGYSRTLKYDSSMNLISYLISPFLYFFCFFSLLRLVKKEKIDIISSHWIIPNGFIAAVVSKVSGVPFTVTIPGSDVYMGEKNFFFRWMVGFASKNASSVISDSSHYLKQLNNLGFYPKKTEVIRYGVNVFKFHPDKKDDNTLQSLGIKRNEQVILAVGRMVAKKGFVYLIKAMKLVLGKKPNARLVLVGDGEEKKRLSDLINKLKITKNVVFAGAKPYNELSKYYNIADVFVMPSVKDEKGNIDASPVAMMEAMACGIPVVATYFSGNLDLVVKDKTGCLIKEKNVASLAEAVIHLLNNAAKLNLKKYVREIAENNFSSRVTAKRYVDIFKNVI